MMHTVTITSRVDIGCRMFWAGCVYGRRDDGQRFDFFCRAALEFLMHSGQTPVCGYEILIQNIST